MKKFLLIFLKIYKLIISTLIMISLIFIAININNLTNYIAKLTTCISDTKEPYFRIKGNVDSYISGSIDSDVSGFISTDVDGFVDAYIVN